MDRLDVSMAFTHLHNRPYTGSSLLVQLTNILALDALRAAGLTRMAECAVLPLATGMAMTLTLLTLADRHRQQRSADVASGVCGSMEWFG